MAYLYLAGAIVFEILGTNLLKKTEGFTNLLYTAIVLISYGVAFYGLSIAVKTLPIGLVYATWSGAGIVLVALVSYILFKQPLDMAAIIGMSLIVVGVFLMNVVSKTAGH